MPTERIFEDENHRPSLCQSPEHNPPRNVVFEPGLYKHTCPLCGHITMFRLVQRVVGRQLRTEQYTVADGTKGMTRGV